MSALLAGSTGLVGHEIAKQWTQKEPLHLLVRRDITPQHASHRVHVVDFAALPPLPRATHAYCALGTTIAQAGSQAAFRAVDFDAVLAFARAARAAGVTHFGAVSALGADATSGNFYSRTKGEAEAALQTLGFRSLVLARPSLLSGDRAALGQPTRLGERLALALASPLAPLLPRAWRPIAAATVARALVQALQQTAPGVQVLSSAAMQTQAGGRGRAAP